MRKFFLIQSVVILLLICIQNYVQEGTMSIQAVVSTLSTLLILISLTFALAVIVTGIRKLLNRRLNFADGVIRVSIFVLPFYYVFQLIGWLYDQGIIGGKG